MSAYSFQLRFVPFIEEGSKNCTVRALRFGRVQHVRPGGAMQLYTCLRTKQCRKIGDATCSTVHPIIITATDISMAGCFMPPHPNPFFIPHPRDLLDVFAWRDGFRPEGSTMDNPAGAFQLMVRFISKNYGVPFEGVAIFWKDFIAAK